MPIPSRTILSAFLIIVLIIALGLLGAMAVGFGLRGVVSQEEATALTVLALLPPFIFVVLERYLNQPYSSSAGDNTNDKGGRLDLRIWGYGMVLGAGLAVLYLFARAVISSVNESSLEVSTSALAKADSIRTAATNAASDTNVQVADSTLLALAGHSGDVASLALWHDGLLLFFLSVALAVVMYALVNVSRSEI